MPSPRDLLIGTRRMIPLPGTTMVPLVTLQRSIWTQHRSHLQEREKSTEALTAKFLSRTKRLIGTRKGKRPRSSTASCRKLRIKASLLEHRIALLELRCTTRKETSIRLGNLIALELAIVPWWVSQANTNTKRSRQACFPEWWKRPPEMTQCVNQRPQWHRQISKS